MLNRYTPAPAWGSGIGCSGSVTVHLVRRRITRHWSPIWPSTIITQEEYDGTAAPAACQHLCRRPDRAAPGSLSAAHAPAGCRAEAPHRRAFLSHLPLCARGRLRRGVVRATLHHNATCARLSPVLIPADGFTRHPAAPAQSPATFRQAACRCTGAPRGERAKQTLSSRI